LTSHYETLAVAVSATPDEIKAAWRRASSAAHPDRAGGDTAQQQALNKAYSVLSDPDARRAYDKPAIELLRSAFDTALAKGAEPVGAATAALERTKGNIEHARADLSARQGLTIAKTGPNLVEELLAAKLEKVAQDMRSVDLALLMLKSYVLPEQTLTQGQIADRKAKGLPLYG